MAEDIKTRWLNVSSKLLNSILRKELIIASNEEVLDVYYNEMGALRVQVRKVKS